MLHLNGLSLNARFLYKCTMELKNGCENLRIYTLNYAQSGIDCLKRHNLLIPYINLKNNYYPYIIHMSTILEKYHELYEI